jgi:hypothetical protein
MQGVCRRVIAAVCCALGVSSGVSAQETCSSAVPINVDVTVTGSSAGMTSDPAAVCAPSTSRDVWFSIVPAVSGLHTVSSCGSAYDTVLSLHTACGAFPIACNDDSCGTASQMVVSLVAGTTYYIRLAASGADSPGGNYAVTVTTASQTAPPNNACATPVALTAGIPLNATSNGATGSDISPCGGADTNDVWFSFLASTPGTHVVSVCSNSMDTVVSVFSSCFSGPIVCDDDSQPVCGPSGSQVGFSASLGQTFLIRVAGAGGSFGPFTITVHAPVGNDACANATPLVLDSAVNGLTNPTCVTEGAAPCAPPSGADVWHTFTATGTADHTFSLCSGATFDTTLTVYSACPGSGGTVLGCNDDACGLASSVTLPLSVGQTVRVRVAGKANAVGTYSLGVTIATPPNDQCQNASDLFTGVQVQTSTVGATGSDVSTCGAGDTRDLWYRFVPPALGLYEFNTCGSALDTVLSIHADCTGPAIACSDNDTAFCGGAGDDGRIVLQLNAGTPYFVRVAGVGSSQGAISLVVYQVPPLNDQCATPVELQLNVPVAGTTTGATGADLSSCGSGDSADLWYSFTPDTPGYYQFRTCGSPANTVLSLHTACGSQSITCNDDDTVVCTPGSGDSRVVAYINAGQTMLVRLSVVGVASGPFQLLTAVAPPPNDECGNAMTLTLDSPSFGTTTGATGTDITTTCGQDDAVDVFYRFVPPASGIYRISTCVGVNSLDTSLAVYQSCGGQLLLCSELDETCGGGNEDLAGLDADLLAGLSYVIRVAGENNETGPFGIIVRFPAPANDTCLQAQDVTEGEFPFETWGATAEPVFFTGACSGVTTLQRDVWFRYTPSSSGDARMSLCDSSFDTFLVLSSATSGCPTGIYPSLACNDNFDCDNNPGTGNLQSRVDFPVIAGRSYFLQIGSRFDTPGVGMLDITLVPRCPCDWNGVGGLSTQDVFDFLTSWQSGSGDFNQQGGTSVQDIFDFLECFVTRPGGC